MVNVDILIIKGDKILLGLLTKKWTYTSPSARLIDDNYNGGQVYGAPGRDIRFGEKIGETVKRNIKEEFGCNVTKYKIICVNANYALGNHYIGIGVAAEIDDEPKLLIPEDWEKWKWFDRNSIPKNLFPPAKNLIDCYLKNKINISE